MDTYLNRGQKGDGEIHGTRSDSVYRARRSYTPVNCRPYGFVIVPIGTPHPGVLFPVHENLSSPPYIFLHNKDTDELQVSVYV